MKGNLWKSTKKIIIILVTLVVIIIGFFSYKYISVTKNPFNGTSEKNISLTISQGESFYSVLDKLKTEGILKSPLITKIYLKLHSFNGSIKPGEYEIPIDSTLEKFVSMVENGDTANYRVTFPEGYTVEQIAEKLSEMGIVNKEEFLTAVKNYPLPSFIKANSERRYNLEGFLYPDTYEIPRNYDSNQIITMMLNRFKEVMLKVQKDTGVNIPESDYEKYVNIAAMIEREASSNENRALVSSVIYNRLKIGMPLQIDATVLYALGEHKNIVTYKDLEVKSPYNTYEVKGLPVGPICNPGIESLIAAVKPATTDYIYYILTPDHSYFTNNYQDFLKKKNEIIGN
ncbi:MAG: endolytic transglycosylase MltG [Sarcina sp.]